MKKFIGLLVLSLALLFAGSAIADYIVTYSSTGAGTKMPVRDGQDVNWVAGDARIVSDEVIGKYTGHPDFTTSRYNPAGANETLAAATTLTDADCGKTFILSHATEFDTDLPGVAYGGCKIKFIVGAAPSGASYTVTAATAVIDGMVFESTPGYTACANESLITFADGLSLVGDYVELMSDGTNWWINGITAGNLGITCTAP